MKSLTKFANAKINLGLEVLNKRDDGYHNINTIFAPISLCDELVITKSDSYELFCNIDFNLPIEKNLAIKAAIMLNNKLGKNDTVSIKLTKNIPSGAGLGGGSSDAASVLTAMNELFDYGLSKDKLAEIAIEVGADVPFFIYNKPAKASGRGELFEFLDLKLTGHILIVYPNISISTAGAYKSLKRGTAPINGSDFVSALSSCNSEVFRVKLFNNFEENTFKEFPDIERIKNALYNYGSNFALMSGSGSSVFGLFDEEETAKRAELNFARDETFICQFI